MCLGKATYHQSNYVALEECIFFPVRQHRGLLVWGSVEHVKRGGVKGLTGKEYFAEEP